jgi:hypothetical protein
VKRHTDPIVILILFGLQACAARPKPEPAYRPIPTDLQQQIQRSIDFGRRIYFQDRVSAIGTDVVFANISESEKAGLGGYLTVRDGYDDGREPESSMVLFLTRDDPPHVQYRIWVPWEHARDSSFERVLPPEPLPERLLTLSRARAAAIKAAGPFSQSINPVVLPAGEWGEPGDILVELLAGTTKPHTLVMGKHFRVLVSADGMNVKSVTPLSKAAMELSTVPPQGAKEMAGLFVSQIVTDYPVETHVFASISSRLPIFVATGRGIWRVENDTIRLLCSTKDDCKSTFAD